MYTPPRSLTTPHERRRLLIWTLALLNWIVAVLFAGREITLRQLCQRCRHISLDRLTRTATRLLIVRASELARVRPPARLRFFYFGHDLRRPQLIRALLGSRLRRALKPKTLSARIAALIQVLRHLDAYAHILAARLKRRLTRRWPITPAPAPAARVPGAAALALAFADSS